jgi:hypothetical protein
MLFPASARACLHSLTAVLGIALVLALNVLAVWPTGHTWLHAVEKKISCPHSHAHNDTPTSEEDDRDAEADDCIIVKFAQGGASFTATPEFFLAPLTVRVATRAIPRSFAAASPAQLLPPGCGPPSV